MKFVFTADIHLSRYGQDKIEDTTNLPERLFSIREALQGIADYCKANEIWKFVIGGDLLHGKSVIYALAQSLMLDFFRDNSWLEFIVIDGNHDLSGKGKGAVSALKSIDNEPNVTRIKENCFLSPDDILFVPYSNEMVDIIKNNKAKFLVSHFGLNEGILNSGISIVADLKASDLIGKYRYVLLGHYHKPQDMVNPQIQIYYAGSPIQLDWGEKNEIKRFMVVDTEKEIIDSVPTFGYKKYVEYIITEENKTEIIENARGLKKDGHHVKIVREEEVDIGDAVDEFRIVDKTKKDITNRGINSSMTQSDILSKYLEIKEINDIEQYLSVGLDIINSCEGVEDAS